MAAVGPSSGAMLNVLIKNPFDPKSPRKLQIDRRSSVLDLKKKLSKDSPNHPTLETQRLVFHGLLLPDSFLLRKAQFHDQQPILLHLFLKQVPGVSKSTLGPPVSTSFGGYTSTPSFMAVPLSHVHAVGMHQAPNPMPPQPVAEDIPEPERIVPVVVEERRFWMQRYINIKLAAKLLILIFLFGQDGDSTRLFMLCFAAVITYIHQMGFLWYAPGGRNNNNERADAPRDPVNNGSETARASPAAIPERPSLVFCIERFIVGFFASLVPSWRPATV